MPKWGLTRAQIESKPWGIPANWLRPTKTVTDPIHGDIYLNELERQFLDSPALQRLRRVRQLGTAHWVYPGSTESRLAHSLGTLRAAQDLLDAVIDSWNGPRPADDLLSEWDLTPDADGISEFDRRWAEVTVLARLGALLHDLCHVPYGHTIEDDLGVLTPHDENVARFGQVWAIFPGKLRAFLRAHEEFRRELIPLIISKDPELKDPETGKARKFNIEELKYPFVADIVGNTICADLMDYLRRDHIYAGLPIGLGHRFMNDFYVSRSGLKDYAKRMVIRIKRDGARRPDIVTELLKYLRFRYELSERVIYHHAKLAADAMVDKLLEMWSDWIWVEKARVHQPELVQSYGKRDLTRLKEEIRHMPAPKPDAYLPEPPRIGVEPPTNLADAIDQEVRDELESHFIARSDDGLLEYLRDWAAKGAPEDKRRTAIGRLATGLLNRELYKLIGRANTLPDQAKSEKKHDEFGRPGARRHLEEGASDAVPLDHHWYVVTWVPSPDMRLKVAEVLIEEDGEILPLDKSGFPGVREIYENHEKLWSINVYAHPSIVPEESEGVLDYPPAAEVVIAYLGEEMGLDMRRRDGTSVGTMFDLAMRKLIEEYNLRDDDVQRMGRAVAAHQGDPGLGGRARTFDQTYQRLKYIAMDEGIIPRE